MKRNQRKGFEAVPSKGTVVWGQVLCVLFLVAASTTAHAAVWYVDKANASGIEDGTAWGTAFATVQPAIDAASDAGGGQVWVAQGVYDEVRHNEGGAIVCKSYVHLYGGFAGHEKSLAKRDMESHETVLDGSASRDGHAAYHVVEARYEQGMLVDGFTIRGGRARNASSSINGGGLHAYSADLVVRQCRFIDNDGRHGGGMACSGYGSRVQIEDCVFDGNRAAYGGALYASAVDTIARCLFTNNNAYRGGAVYAHSGRFTECVFAQNYCDGEGGAVYNVAGISSWYAASLVMDITDFPQYINCVFYKNMAANGGAVANHTSVSVMLVNWVKSTKNGAPPSMLQNCTLAANHATRRGGGVYDNASIDYWTTTWTDSKGPSWKTSSQVGKNDDDLVALEARNCILWENTPDQIYNGFPSAPLFRFTVRFSNVDGGYDGIGNIDEDPDFLDPGNDSYLLGERSPCIDAGTLDGAPVSDMLGVPRHVGMGCDMGAYEFVDHDRDSDGLPDSFEGGGDPDGDGLPNRLDPDSDGDGIADSLEGIRDSDSDGIPDFLDPDSDGDHIPDRDEGAGDPDYDGIPNYIDLDSDNDTRSDAWEGTGDADEDSLPDYLDPDSDGDGIPDSEERFVVFVDKGNSSGPWDGKTWDTAFTSVQDGIDTAQREQFIVDNAEVRVAAGVYGEDRSEHDGAIQMIDGIDLLGGYAPEGNAPRARDWTRHETRLDASMSLNGGPGLEVIVAAGATLEGFVIRDFSRSAVRVVSHARIAHCVFENNTGFDGSAMKIVGNHVIIADCTFSGCQGRYGGAVYVYYSTCDIVRCRFLNNAASKDGGAVYAYHSTCDVVRCRFLNNAADKGGAIFITWTTMNLDNCLFEGNTANDGGAALYVNAYSLATMTHCTLQNSAAMGAIHLYKSDATVVNCILVTANPFDLEHNSSVEARHCLIPGGYEGAGNIGGNPRFADAGAGDFRLASNSPCIDSGGFTAGLSRVDLGGADRYRGLRPDMGAFEFTNVSAMPFSSADTNYDFRVELSELLRVVQFRNEGGYHCAETPNATEDGFVAGVGAAWACARHTSDYAPPDWSLNLSELLRLVQFFNQPGHAYHYSPGTEDGFAPGSGPSE